MKALATPEMVYHPDRLKHPLKRMGERGEDNGSVCHGMKPSPPSQLNCRISAVDMGRVRWPGWYP